jgi:methylase of polypeptide subunit release factors
VAGERFDLVVTNPPFVISPATGERLVYRDSGLPGDRAVEHVVRALPRHLAPGGIGQVLANWSVLHDRPWDERLTEWTDGSGCDVWVVQREVLDPAEYVELWLKDAGLHGAGDYLSRYDTWLSWFEDEGVEGVGFGWINLKETGELSGDRAQSRFEEWRWEVEQPLGPEVAAHFARVSALRNFSDDRLRGMRRARQVDTVDAAVAGASDGDLSVGQLLAAVAQLLGDEAVGDRLDGVRELLAEGFLELE